MNKEGFSTVNGEMLRLLKEKSSKDLYDRIELFINKRREIITHGGDLFQPLYNESSYIVMHFIPVHVFDNQNRYNNNPDVINSPKPEFTLSNAPLFDRVDQYGRILCSEENKLKNYIRIYRNHSIEIFSSDFLVEGLDGKKYITPSNLTETIQRLIWQIYVYLTGNLDDGNKASAPYIISLSFENIKDSSVYVRNCNVGIYKQEHCQLPIVMIQNNDKERWATACSEISGLIWNALGYKEAAQS